MGVVTSAAVTLAYSPLSICFKFFEFITESGIAGIANHSCTLLLSLVFQMIL